jgi:hypothetical protein
MKRFFLSLILVFAGLFFNTGAVASDPNYGGDTLTFDDVNATCPSSHPIRTGESGKNPDGSSYYRIKCVRQQDWDVYLIGGDIHQEYRDSGGTLDVAAAIQEYKQEQNNIRTLQENAQREAEAEAAKNPGVQVCRNWSYTSKYSGSGSGGICTIVPIQTSDVVETERTNSVFQRIRAELEADPQYAVLRYGVNNQTFDYSPSERAALLDQWAANMAGEELARNRARKQAERNPGKQVCTDWSIAGQSGQVCAYVPVAITTAAMLSDLKTQISDLDISGAEKRKVNNFALRVANRIPDEMTQRRILLPKAPENYSLAISTANPDSCRVQGRRVIVKKGEMCEVNVALTTPSEKTVQIKQTVERKK